jgi:hypothetical protein
MFKTKFYDEGSMLPMYTQNSFPLKNTFCPTNKKRKKKKKGSEKGPDIQGLAPESSHRCRRHHRS